LAMDYFINENEDSEDPFSQFLENWCLPGHGILKH
jgi:hypothetical protein